MAPRGRRIDERHRAWRIEVVVDRGADLIDRGVALPGSGPPLEATGGDPWYGSATLSVISGLTAAQAAARPVDGGHSIWETVLHVVSWRNEVARRLEGAEPALPLEGDWPDPGEATEERWELAKAELVDSARRLAARVAAFAAESWERPVGDDRAPELGTGVPFAEMAAGILQHDAYHTGQIALLRKMALASEGS